MAVFTRTNGDAKTVVSVGNAVSVSAETTGTIIATGIGKPPIALAITANNSVAAQMGSGEVVEQLLRWVGGTTTMLAYQVDAAQISILVEDGDISGLDTTNANANITSAGFGVNSNGITDVGLKLATS